MSLVATAETKGLSSQGMHKKRKGQTKGESAEKCKKPRTIVEHFDTLQIKIEEGIAAWDKHFATFVTALHKHTKPKVARLLLTLLNKADYGFSSNFNDAMECVDAIMDTCDEQQEKNKERDQQQESNERMAAAQILCSLSQ